MALAQSATTTSLTLSTPTTIAAGAVETLTATVYAGTHQLTQGLVTFYDGKTVLGTAQIITTHVAASPGAAGTAVLRKQIGSGPHSLTASYAMQGGYTASTSAAAPLSANGGIPVAINVTATGSNNPYTLTVTATAPGSQSPALSKVDLADVTDNYLQLGSAQLADGSVQEGVRAETTATDGINNYDVVTGDFNNDGYLDIAVPNSRENTLSVLLNAGAGGGFHDAQIVLPGTMPDGLATADFNSDGIPDMVVANLTSNNVTVLLGTGGGGFQVGSTIPVGNNVYAVATGDVNGDGITDIVAVDNGSNGLTVLTGNGDGTFKTAAILTTGSEPENLVVVDLNGDGILDLALQEISDVKVFLGRGNGSFQPAQTVLSIPPDNGYPLLTLATADFNGDGVPDLAVSEQSSVILVLLGNGDGSFGSPVNTAVGNSNSTLALVALDFNGDGITDLAEVPQGGYGGGFAVLQGKGDGTFSPLVSSSSLAGEALALAAGDFNGDGNADIAIAYAGAGAVTVELSTPVGTSTGTLAGALVPGSGMHAVVGLFSEGPYFEDAASDPLQLAASLIPTTLGLRAPGTTVYGDTVTLTAQLSPYIDGALSADHEGVVFNVTTSQGTRELARVPLSGGVATLTTTALPAGTDQVTASFVTDGLFASATSSPDTVTVGTPGANNGSLKGQYAFLLHGFLPFGGSAPYGIAAAGSFTADGQGNITGGIEDIDNAFGSAFKVSVRGQYSLGADGRGTLTLNGSNGVSVVLGVAVSQLGVDGTAAAANLFLETNDFGANAGGTLLQQAQSGLDLNALAGSWAFGLSGETACYVGCSYPDHAGGAVSGTWMLSVSGSSLNGTADLEVAQILFQGATLSGSLEPVDGVTGRLPFTIKAGATSDEPIDYVMYVIDGERTLLMSMDPHSSAILLSGVGKRQ